MYTYEKTVKRGLPVDQELQAIEPIYLDILYRRGYTTEEAMRDILFPDIKKALRPLQCQDIKEALDILENAVRKQIPVTVYRDYDADGIAAGAAAVDALSRLGVPVHHYANRREVDGYGICKAGIDQIQERWPETRIILTVDNGISGHEAVGYAVQRGLTVVVTDHHEPGMTLPNAAAVIDLKRADERYPYHDLCGCGLIFRIMLDLYRRLGKDLSTVLDLLDLVALATIADVVPLTGENRALVQYGMKLISDKKRPFFRAMAHKFGVSRPTAHHTAAYYYAPAVNSLSRMGEDTDLAVEAMLTQDTAEAEKLVSHLKETNQRRKEESNRQFEIAKKKLGEQCGSPAIVIWDEEFSSGMIGIIAGQLKELYQRPVIVFAAPQNGILKGSGRSSDEFSLKDALDRLSPYLESYGGHHKAAGLSVSVEHLEQFTLAFTKLAEEVLQGHMFNTASALDAVLDETTLTESFVENLTILEPFGEGFPEPLFGLTLHCDRVRYMGQEAQHVKYTSSSSGISVIGWNEGERARQKTLLPEKFVGKPSLNFWNGQTQVQFIYECAT